MRNWIIVGLVVLALGALWFVLTEPTSDSPEPGALSSHQVDEDQPFDPYLDDDESSAAGDQTQEESEANVSAQGDDADLTSQEGDADLTSQEDEAPAPNDEEDSQEDSPPAQPAPNDETVDEGSAPDPVPSDQNLAQAEARQIADAYLNGASTDPSRNLELYAERVNYYDQGTVSRSDVLRDKKQYLERWPERTYERTSDVEIVDAGAADMIRFNYRYQVSGGSRNAEGTGWAELGVQRRDGRISIVSERGGVTDRK